MSSKLAVDERGGGESRSEGAASEAGPPEAQGSLSLRLAEKILRPQLAEPSARVAAWVRMAVTDTVACMLAGCRDESVSILMGVEGVAPATGGSLVLGTDRRTTTLDAALVNGLAAHALDYDDVLDACVVHASAVIVPVLLALGEGRKSSGRDLMAAYLAGVELGARLAVATAPEHRANGWHPTATLGGFCAVGAAARLLDLNAEQLSHAIGIVASEAAGLQANFGTMTKPFHAGQAARAGILAAQMAAGGFTANPRSLEHRMGFLAVYAQGGQPEIDTLLADIGSPFEMDLNPILKEYPCCALTHNVAGMMLALRAEHGLVADEVASLTIHCHPKAMEALDRPWPDNGLDAKFSNQYVAARALTDGVLRLEQFEDAATQDPAVRAVLARTHMAPHPEMAPGSPHPNAVELVLELVSGERLTLYSEAPAFRSFDNPMSRAELATKFADCAVRALPPERISPLFDRLMEFDTAADLSTILELLTPAG